MKKKRIVLAIGGNGIVDDKGSASVETQLNVINKTAEQVASLISYGHEVIVSFGNGPQAGQLLEQQFQAEKSEALPLDVCVAMTQGMIGYWMQQSITAALAEKGISKQAATVITQVLADENDPAFKHPSKQLGPIYKEEDAKKLQEKTGIPFKEEKGKGWRMTAVSPKPIEIIEKEEILELLSQGKVVIAAGGGGVPVIKKNGRLEGVEAVIDKDWTSIMLADLVEADTVLLLSKANYVFLHYQSPEQKKLENVSVGDIKKFIEDGLFAEGSMLPKMQAGVAFTESRPEKTFIVASYEKAAEAAEEKTGTIIKEE